MMNGTTTKEVGFRQYAEFGRSSRSSDFKLLGARGVCLNNNNNSIVVTDILTDKVIVFQENNGSFQPQFEFLSAKGTLDKHLRHPMDIAMDSGGKYLVVNNSPYVRIYSQSGQYESRFGTLTPADYCDTQVNLQCIASTSDGGIIFVGDHYRKLITIHDSSYDLLGSLSTQDAQPAFLGHDEQKGHIAIGDDITGTLCVLDIQTGQKLLSCQAEAGVRGLVYHSEASSIFITCGSRSNYSNPGSVEQYCVRSGMKVGRSVQNLQRPYGLCSSLDDKVVVCDKDVIKIFELI